MMHHWRVSRRSVLVAGGFAAAVFSESARGDAAYPYRFLDATVTAQSEVRQAEILIEGEASRSVEGYVQYPPSRLKVGRDFDTLEDLLSYARTTYCDPRWIDAQARFFAYQLGGTPVVRLDPAQPEVVRVAAFWWQQGNSGTTIDFADCQ